MKATVGLIATLFLALLVGCGERVEVPTGHVAKVMSPSGLQQGLKGPSSFRLPWNAWWGGKHYLVVVETSDQAAKETIRLFMPKDRLNLTFDVRMMLSIPHDDEQRVESIFARMTPSSGAGRVRHVRFQSVYETYAQPIVREKAREILSEYTIEEVMANREAVSAAIQKRMQEELADTPIVVMSAGLAEIQPPDVIVKANELAKEREIEIQRAEADKAIAMAKADANLEVAKKQQEVDLVEAETQRLVNEVLAKSVNPAFVTQRMVKVMEAMAASNNKVFVIPEAYMSDPAMLMGINTQALKAEDSK